MTKLRPTNGASATSAPSKKELLSSTANATPTIPATGEIPYETGVAICEPRHAQINAQIKANWLVTCDVADRLEPKYGRKTHAQFAADIGADYDTLKRYLSTYRAWKPHWGGAPPKSLPASWAVLQAFAPDPAFGIDTLKHNPNITQDDARDAMAIRKGGRRKPKPPPQKEGWQENQAYVLGDIMRAVQLINNHANFMEDYDEQPERERGLAKRVEALPTLLQEVKLAREKSLPALDDYLQALPDKYVEHAPAATKSNGRGRVRIGAQPQSQLGAAQ
jgi:hypothetical protein